jgi:anthranilate phosphoribosyltransferase
MALGDKNEILGGDATFNAKLTTDLLSKKLIGSKLNIVLLNAAAALIVDEKARDFQDGIEIAKDAILSGKAKEKLDQIIKISNQLS